MLPGLIPDDTPMSKYEIAIENIEIIGKMEVSLAKHQAIVSFVGTHYEILDHGKKDQVPFVKRYGIIDSSQVLIGSR